MNNIIIAQSGGPTVAINASLAGVLSSAIESSEYDKVFGSVHGITGILDENVLDLTEKVEADPEFVEKLKISPAMYLGSCRFKLPAIGSDDATYDKIFDFFKNHEIKAFFYIGGNDSMDTVDKLSKYAKQIGSDVRIIGIPKTIDNDLMITDHTPGYGSAAKYIAASTLEVAHDTYIYNVKSVTILEIMGRDAGWLTAATALARNEYNTAPHLIYLPELPFSEKAFLSDIRKQLAVKNNIIVAVSEGIRDEYGRYISAGNASADTFGHAQLSGTGKTLERMVKETFDIKVRSIELNVLQRCASHFASLTDLEESFTLGKEAVKYASEGATGAMVILKRESNAPYSCKVDIANIEGIANAAKSVPTEWISEEGNDVKQELIDYMKPLIQGEPQMRFKDGLPTYLPVLHLKGKPLPTREN